MNDGAVSQEQDLWDWPYIFYVGRTLLGFSDQELWNVTPRYFKSQWDAHVAYSNSQGEQPAKEKVSAGFIDQVQGW